MEEDFDVIARLLSPMKRNSGVHPSDDISIIQMMRMKPLIL